MLKKLIPLLVACLFATAAGKKDEQKTVTLEKGKVSVLSGQVNTESMQPIIQDILASKAKTHTIYIDSPGGSVMAGNDLIRAMKSSGKEIVCVADVAISMAFAIFQQCDKRYVTDGAVLMQHLISYGMQGNHRHNTSQWKFANQISKHMQERDAKAMNVPLAKFVDNVRDDWWMYGKNAITEGAADEMVTVKCSDQLLNERVKGTKQVFVFKVSYEKSACPLIRGALKKEVKKETKAPATKKQQMELDYFLATLNTSIFINNIKMDLMRPRLWF